jgi:hypothetical protein
MTKGAAALAHDLTRAAAELIDGAVDRELDGTRAPAPSRRRRSTRTLDH